jgi:hypothetical protein
MFGIVKEVAPAVNAKTDEELGVAEFQREYFPYPLYLDEAQGFYEALGKRVITKDLEGTWNPFKFFDGLKDIGVRLKAKNIEGNMAGDGLVLGGVFVIDSDAEDVTYVYKEATGKEIPREEIADAVKAVRSAKSSIFSSFV